ARWIRQLRARLGTEGIRWMETRTEADLERAVTGTTRVVLLIDGSAKDCRPLDVLARIEGTSCDPCILVLLGRDQSYLSRAAYEMGASAVLESGTPPPAVAALVSRWVKLLRSRG